MKSALCLVARRGIWRYCHSAHGSQHVLVLGGYEAIWEALVDQAEAFPGQGLMAIIDPSSRKW